MSLFDDITTSKIIAIFTFRGEEVILTEGGLRHARERHGDIKVEEIELCIENPEEIQKSKRDPKGFRVYFKSKTDGGDIIYFVTVVRRLKLGNYIWTAYESEYKKNGEIVFRSDRK